MLPPTPSQTIGPFFGHALTWADGPFVVPAGWPGGVRVWGYLYDGERQPVPDALVETWQADPEGHFAHPDDPRLPDDPAADAQDQFRGFGRSAADADGRFEIWTVKPGQVPAPDGRLQAPHLDVSVFARGLLQRVVTRIYFGDEASANADDPVLLSVEEARRATLVAQPDDGGYRLDVHLQGADETVFFVI